MTTTNITIFCQFKLDEYGIEQGILREIEALGNDYHYTILGQFSERFEALGKPLNVTLQPYPIYPAFHPVAIRTLMSDLRGANLIITTDPRARTLAAPAARLLKRPIIHQHHNTPLNYPSGKVRYWLNYLGEKVLGRYLTTEAHFASRTMLNWYVERGLMSKHHAYHVPVGVNIDRLQNTPDRTSDLQFAYRLPENTFVMLHVGRLTHQKAQDMIIEAVAHLPEHLDWRLFLVGEGSLREQLEADVRTRPFANRIIFTGHLPHCDVLDLLRLSDVLLLPSRFEYAPVILMEALALQTPAIVTPVGDAWEMVGSSDLPSAGMSVPVDDPESLTHAIRRLMDNPDMLQQFKVACAARAPRYDAHHRTKFLKSAYTRLL